MCMDSPNAPSADNRSNPRAFVLCLSAAWYDSMKYALDAANPRIAKNMMQTEASLLPSTPDSLSLDFRISKS